MGGDKVMKVEPPMNGIRVLPALPPLEDMGRRHHV